MSNTHSKSGKTGKVPGWTPFIGVNQLCWFVGYNPGIRSFETQAYYAHPTNRFWKLLHEGGFVPELLIPADYRRVQEYHFGLIDLSMRPTVSGTELTRAEFEHGRERIVNLVTELHPQWLAANGLGIARVLSGEKKRNDYGDWGTLAGTSTRLWALPSSSGRAGARQGSGMTYAEKLEEWKKFRKVLYVL